MAVISIENVGVRFFLRKESSVSALEKVMGRFFTRGDSTKSHKARTEPFWALRDVSFEVEEGEFLGIIGRNGAGKSTLLQVLAGIYEPDEGSVIRRGQVGLLQLGTGFHPKLSGRDNVYLAGAMFGLSRNEINKRFESIVRFSELGEFIDSPLKSYSSGMAARLGFSVAVHVEPEITLLDEIFAVGDENFKKKSQERMLALQKKGKTFVFVSHALESVQRMCGRVIYLKNGTVVAAGTAAEVIECYREDIACDG